MKIPTIEEMAAFIEEKEYTHCDAMACWYYYDSNGWMVGKVKMKNWKSAVAGWHHRAKKQAEKAPKSTFYGKQSIEARGKAVGIEAGMGESYEAWERRIQAAERVQRTRH